MASNFRVDNLENTGSITIAAGDLIMTGGIELTGDLSLLSNSYLRFNSPGENDQFVFGNNSIITLDADDGIILKADSYIYHNVNDSIDNVFTPTYTAFNAQKDDIDFRVNTNNYYGTLFIDGSNDTLFLGVEDFDVTPDASEVSGYGDDVKIYLSGAAGTKDSSTRGVTLNAGDFVVSGSSYFYDDINLKTNKTIYFNNPSGTADQFIKSVSDVFLRIDSDDYFQVYADESIDMYVDNGITLSRFEMYPKSVDINRTVRNTTDFSANGYLLYVSGGHETVVIGGNTQNPVYGTDVNIHLSGSTGTKDTSTRGVTLVSGDMVVSGTTYFPSDVVVDANTRVYFDGTGNSGFGGPYIYGNTVALNIDGDNRLSLRYDDDLYVLDSSNSNVTFQLIDSAKTDSFSEFGDDIVAFISGSKGSKDQTGSRGAILFSGDTITSGSLHIDSGIRDKFTTKSSATGTVVHDCEESTVFNHSSISANFTANFTNLNLSSGYATSLTLILNQGATAYMTTGVQIGGAAQTIEWQGGSAPSGTSSGIDVVSFSIINSAGTYTVLGQSVSYS